MFTFFGKVHCRAKKLHPFYFCNNFVKPHYFDNFWYTDTEVNLQQNCNKIAHLSWWLFSLYRVKRNISQFVHNNSNVRLQSWQLCRNITANIQRLLLALRHALKQSCHWSVAWSMKICWLLTTFQSHAASAHWRPSLVSDKHVPACRFQAVSPCAAALVWFSCSQGWKWMVHITVMSCCSTSCCQTSVKLLPTFAFQHTTHAQERWAAATQDSGLHTRRGLLTDQTSVL